MNSRESRPGKAVPDDEHGTRHPAGEEVLQQVAAGQRLVGPRRGSRQYDDGCRKKTGDWFGWRQQEKLKHLGLLPDRHDNDRAPKDRRERCGARSMACMVVRTMIHT